SFFLRWISPVPRGAGARRAEKQCSAIGKGEISAVSPQPSVLRSKSIDDDFGARQQRLFGKASPVQRGRGPCFDRPVFYSTVLLFHVHVDPDVGIDPFHLRDRSLELERPIRVKFRRTGVM